MNVRREGVGSPEPPRDTCAGCQPAPTWAAQSQARCGETRPATAVPNRIAFQAFARSMLPSLRHRGFVRPATPALGHGQPLAASSVVAQVVNLCHGPSVRGGSGLHRSLVAQVVNLCHGAAQVENLRSGPHPLHRVSTCAARRSRPLGMQARAAAEGEPIRGGKKRLCRCLE